jgi:hypothetical protein
MAIDVKKLLKITKAMYKARTDINQTTERRNKNAKQRDQETNRSSMHGNQTNKSGNF